MQFRWVLSLNAQGYVQEFYKIPEVCMSVWSIFDAILALARLESYARPIYAYLFSPRVQNYFGQEDETYTISP